MTSHFIQVTYSNIAKVYFCFTNIPVMVIGEQGAQAAPLLILGG